VQSLLLAEPRLLELVVKVLAYAPELARTLARRPAVLDALLDPGFFAPLAADDVQVVQDAARAAEGFEDAMDAVRRVHREQAFRIGVQVMSGVASAEEAGAAFAALADACIGALAPAAVAEVERVAGAFPGQLAVIALGKCGSREMTARSDLDLMTLYRADDPAAASATKAWSADTFFGRFTQRLVAALSAPTGEGGLYEVDLQLRPSGTSGPVAVSFRAFEGYYERSAETWELLALTRARVAWASSPAFAEDAAAAIEAALRRPRDPGRTAQDVLEMRALMERERPAGGAWDMKLSPGGLVDIEFSAQHLEIVHAGSGGPIRAGTVAALQALAAAGLAPERESQALIAAWTLQQNLSQLLKLALPDNADPEAEPKGFRQLLARAGSSRDFAGLRRKLERARAEARGAFVAILNSSGAKASVER
jgi:glutamate-ammonia-ligase adenylyltransferase